MSTAPAENQPTRRSPYKSNIAIVLLWKCYKVTLEQIGQMLGVTRERARQRKNKGLDYLREAAREIAITPDLLR